MNPCNKIKTLLASHATVDCFSHSTVAREKNKEFRIETQYAVCKVKNDGCLSIDNNEKKCDFIFYCEESKHLFLVELKGEDVVEAVQQIRASYRKFAKAVSKEKLVIKGIVVSGGVPRAADVRFRNLQKECLRQDGLHIGRSTNKHVESI